VIERAVQGMEGHARAMKRALEKRWSAKVPEDHAIIPWMFDYAAVLLNRYEVGRDGRTSYERLKGKRSDMAGIEFGEGVRFKKAAGKKQAKMEVRWEDGVYLGVKPTSGEVLCGTKEGVWKTRSVMRKTWEERWSPTNAEMVGGVPWKVTEGDEATSEPMWRGEIIEEGDGKERAVKEADEETEGFKDFSITEKDLEKHGYSRGCQGCRAVIAKTARQGHSSGCRERLRKEMKGEKKVQEASRRKTSTSRER
jgi:hypothetical protein